MTERLITLEGALNVRDVGGYATADDRLVRRGCVYRSGEMCSLTDADVAVIGSLGIRVVIDLRHEVERAARPNRLWDGVRLIERTTPASTAVPDPTLEEQIALGEVPVKDTAYITDVYIDLLERLAPEFKVILEYALDAVGTPILFHCQAGKDRTGVAAAVLLGVLGVPDATIIEDYELTNTHYTVRRLEGLSRLLADSGVEAAAIRHLVEARTPALEAALSHLHTTWGSFDGYAEHALGVDPHLPEQLRSRLTMT